MTRFKAGFLAGGSFSGVDFDGSDYLRRNSTVGASDGSKAIGSFWFKATRDGSNELIMLVDGAFQIQKSNSNVLLFTFRDTGGTADLVFQTTNTVTVADGWVHVLWAFDMPSYAYVYINDVDDTTNTTSVADTYNFTSTVWVHGSNVTATANMVCDIGQFWMHLGNSLDISTESNRRKFVNSDLTPKNLGTDGTRPGLTPQIFFDGGSSTYSTNAGSGGAFSLTGSLTTVTFP